MSEHFRGNATSYNPPQPRRVIIIARRAYLRLLVVMWMNVQLYSSHASSQDSSKSSPNCLAMLQVPKRKRTHIDDEANSSKTISEFVPEGIVSGTEAAQLLTEMASDTTAMSNKSNKKAKSKKAVRPKAKSGTDEKKRQKKSGSKKAPPSEDQTEAKLPKEKYKSEYIPDIEYEVSRCS